MEIITTDKLCHVDGSCPFSGTDSSEYVQDLGCLPSPIQIAALRVYYGKTWACHEDYSKPCKGAIKFLKDKGLPHKVEDSDLVTEKCDWGPYRDTIETNTKKLIDHLWSEGKI